MKRATKAELAARVEEILHARLNGAEFHDLQALAAEKQWNVSASQLWRYVQAADQRIEETFEPDRAKLFRRHVFQRRALYARALQDGDYRTSLAILKDEAELHGLYAAKRHEVTGRDGGPLESVSTVVEMSEDERAAAIAALLARVGQGHRGPALTGQADGAGSALGTPRGPDDGGPDGARSLANRLAPFPG
jgi:hypothetical protein